MNMENISTDPSYIAYMRKVAGMVSALPKSGQLEIQNEIRSHIYESLRNSPGLSVEGALERFGEPGTFLPEWVILKKMEVAVKSFDPVRIARALFLGISGHAAHAFKYVLFSILYLLTFSFAALPILKIIFPANTGLIILPHGFIFGHTSNMAGGYEVMGWWFIPFCLFVAILLYVIITVLLRRSLTE